MTAAPRPTRISGTPELKLILVGRPDVDASLRGDAQVELVRVPSALDAIVELAGVGGVRSAVLVGPDADPAREGEPRAADWVEALRRVDPGVRVLGVGTRASAYDGELDAGADGKAVRAALESRSSPDAGPPGAIEVRAVGLADEPLARVLLQGGDVRSAALSLMERRVPGLTFSKESGRVAVSWRGTVFGWLDGADAALLEPQAAWLGAWIALGEQHAQLREAAFTDPLTGAWNRRYFEQFLAAAIDEAGRARRNLTILMFDIDDFKKFNDAHGHPAGDMILRETVRLLASVIRPSDKVCRIGGDEFAVIFHEPQGPRTPTSRHPESVEAIARRFQAQVAAQRFPRLGLEAPGMLTISGGLATFPWDGRSPTELVERCDRLMLESKRQGKNVITLGPSRD